MVSLEKLSNYRLGQLSFQATPSAQAASVGFYWSSLSPSVGSDGLTKELVFAFGRSAGAWTTTDDGVALTLPVVVGSATGIGAITTGCSFGSIATPKDGDSLMAS
jgi:hypothetical protein